MPTNDLAKLVVKLETQSAQYVQQLERANKKLSSFEKRQKSTLKRIDGGFRALRGTIAAVGVGVFIRKITQATAAQEAALAQLRQGLETTDNAVGRNLDQLTQYAADLQKVTTFGDEQLIEASAQLVSFTRIQGDEFERTLELAADLSTRFGTDLKSSVLQLGKALNDPIANLSALSRSGIQFSNDQKVLIKALVEAGRQADAQRVILAELETQFGGSARAARDTFGGALEGLNNALGDLLESDSGLVGAQKSIEELTALLADPATKANVDIFVSGLLKLGTLPVAFLNRYVTFVEDIAAAISGPAVDDIGRLNKALEVNRFRLQQINEIEFKSGLSDNLKEEQEDLLRRNVELKRLIDLNSTLASQPDVPAIAPTGPDGAGGKPPEITPPVDYDALWDKAEARAKAAVKGIEQDLSEHETFLNEQTDLTGRLAAVDAFLRTESEAIRFAHEERLAELMEFQENKLITEEEYQARKMALEDRHTENQEAARQRSVAGEKGYLDQLVSLNAAGSKKLNKVTQAASLVNAIIKGFEAQQSAWALPWPGNIAAAALAAATTAANIAGIKGAAHGGMESVPEEGTFLLQRGERVLQPRQNDDLTEFLRDNDTGGGNKNATVNINISALDGANVEEVLARNRGVVTGLIRQSMNDQGRAAVV